MNASKDIWHREILPARAPFNWPRRFFGWLFSWRGLRRILIVLAWLVTLIALFYAEENWRGHRAWHNYQRQLAASNVQVDLTAFIPRPVPDDQNFAATPFVKSWFIRENNGPPDKIWNDAFSPASLMVSSRPPGESKRQFVDLVAWARAFAAVRAGETNPPLKIIPEPRDLVSLSNAAPSVLEGLESSRAHLNELEEASRRPFSHCPVVFKLDDPWGILLPHLLRLRQTCERLQVRACAELALGRSAEALKDVKLMLYLADSLKEESFLISYLVRITCFKFAIHPVWEGLAEHRWSEAQLQEIQTRLLRYDFIAEMKPPLDSERAAAVLTCDLLARGKYSLNNLLPASPESGLGEATPETALIPKGWYDLEKINYCRLYQQELDGTFDASKKKISPSRVHAGTDAMARELAGSAGAGNALKALVLQHRLVAALLLPGLSGVSRRCAEGQTSANQAALACALERYRLSNGQFPEKLEALQPQLLSELPHDILTGEAYKYRRTDNATFLLYYVGWNEKDDGGVPGKSFFDEKQGDWVWSY